MKLVISLILNVIFAIALIVHCFFLRESNLQRGIAVGIIADLKNGNSYSARERHILGKEIDELKAELEKNIAARSRLKEMLAEARKSASKPNASQAQ